MANSLTSRFYDYTRTYRLIFESIEVFYNTGHIYSHRDNFSPYKYEM